MTATLTYIFGNIDYVITDGNASGAIMTITWHKRNIPVLWARFEFKRDGSSTVTTAAVPRFFNAWTIREAQQRFARIIQQGVGASAFKILQAHFDARNLYHGIRNS